MDAKRWQLVRGLFDEIVGTRPETWSERLMSACPDDAVLRMEVLALLEANEDAEQQPTLMGVCAPHLLSELAETTEREQTDSWIGQRLGVWRIVQFLGRGGMGLVYLAERDDGEFRQQAALKLLRPGPDSQAVISRFRSERQILAQLQHPHIAQLLDGGVSAEGMPWFALEYIDGEALTTACDKARWGVRQRLRLFLDACEAVSYAHERLIVHRDIKPGNILVDRQLRVKLLDFGIAKLLDAESDSSRTSTGMHLFTPDYAAPEQIRGEPVTTAVDVYALGMVLYELLTGWTPYRLEQTQPAAVAHAVLTQEPNRLSAVVLKQAQNDAAGSHMRAQSRGMTPLRLSAQLRGDLDAVVLKALRKEPPARYGSVRDLMADVRAVLEHRPVEARRGGVRYRVGRFLRRYALPVAMAVLAMMALFIGMVMALWQASVADRERVAAQVEARKAQASATFLSNLFTQGDPTRTDGADPRASELLEKGAQELQLGNDMDDATRAALLTNIGVAYVRMQRYERGLDLLRQADRIADASADVSDRITTKIVLALALNDSDNYEEALTQLQQARQLYEENEVSDPRQHRNINNLTGTVLVNLKRTREALAFLGRAYDEAQPGSKEQSFVVEVYAQALIDENLFEEAVRIAESAYEASRERRDLSLIQQESFCAAAGLALLRADRPAEAEARFREALELNQRIFGMGHPVTASALHKISVALNNQGRHAEGAEYAEQVLQIRRKHSPAGDEGIARAMVHAGISYSDAGDHARAIPLLVDGLSGLEETMSPQNDIVMNGRMSLVQSYEFMREFQQGLSHAEQLLPLLNDEVPKTLDRKAADFRLRHVRLLMRLGREPDDCSLLIKASGDEAMARGDEVEAAALSAYCFWQAGDKDQALRIRDRIRSSSNDTPLNIDPFTRTLLERISG